MKKCNKAVDKYLEIEDPSHIPFLIRFHMAFCRECRIEILRLKNLFVSLLNESSYEAEYSMTSSIMHLINNERNLNVKKISVFKWVTIGSVIYLSIVLINYSESFLCVKKELGSFYTISMSIVMGLLLSAYSVIFIGCNYEYIKVYIEAHVKWKMK